MNFLGTTNSRGAAVMGVIASLVAFSLLGIFDGAAVSSARAATQPSDPYVVGGVAATIGDAPWQVALLRADGANAYDAQFCGGSLISTDWIVTAAHCVVGDAPEDVRVQAGKASLSTTALGGKSVSEIIVHPGYDPAALANDIALVRLSAPLTPTSGSIQPIELVDLAPEPGANVLVTGWGATDNAGTVYPKGLRKATLKILDDSECSNAYLEYDPVSTLCAGKAPFTTTATCLGDSGGPLAYNSGGKWKLVGLVSFGSADGCISGAPSGFTRISTFADWIGANSSSLAASVGGALLLPVGDGMLDFTTLTISDTKRQSVALTLDPGVTDIALGSLTLTASGAVYRATMTLSLLNEPFSHLSEGVHVIRAETESASIDISVTVQESVIVNAVVATDASVYYPAKDAYLDRILITLTTTGSYDAPIPFRAGIASLFVDGAQRAQCTLGSSDAGVKSCSIDLAGLAASSMVTVTATYQDLSGTAGTRDANPLQFANSYITDAVLTASEAIVYPVHDGYLDSTVLTVDMQSSAEGDIGLVNSKVTIKRGSKTVLTWKLTKSGTYTKTWNGKDGNKVVAGTYTVTISAQGSDGDRFTSSFPITVRKQKLVTKTVTESYTGKAGFAYYESADNTACTYSGSNLEVYTIIDSALCYGVISIPAAVQSHLDSGVKLTATIVVRNNWGDYCGSFSVPETGLTSHYICGDGTQSWNMGTIDAGSTTLMPALYAPSDFTYFIVTKLTLKYTYKTLA